jgi:hypothetical protein
MFTPLQCYEISMQPLAIPIIVEIKQKYPFNVYLYTLHTSRQVYSGSIVTDLEYLVR